MWHLIGLVGAVAAILAAARHRREHSDPTLAEIRRLQAYSAATRREAALELGRNRYLARAAAEPLIELLTDPDPGVRAAVAWALGEIGIPRWSPSLRVAATSALTALLHDKNASVRHTAAVALTHFDPEPDVVVPALTAAAGDPGYVDRGEALQTLQRYFDQHPAAASAILAALADPDPHVQVMAIHSLLWRGGSIAANAELRDAFLATTRSQSARVRLVALGRLSVDCATDATLDGSPLIAALSDPDADVRATIAESMPPRLRLQAIPEFCRALTDTDPRVRLSAARAFTMMNGSAEEALPALRTAQARTKDAPTMETLRRTIERIEDDVERYRETVLSPIREKLASHDHAVRSEAVASLGALVQPDRECLRLLVETLDDESAQVRRAAASTLGAFGTAARRHLTDLTKRSNDPDPTVRAAVAWARSAIGGALEAYEDAAAGDGRVFPGEVEPRR